MTSGAREKRDEIEVDLATAVAYRFVAAAFRHPADESVAALLELGEGLPDAARLLDGAGGKLTLAVAEMRDFLTGDRSPSELREELAKAYTRLFGHSVGVGCPPYETEYGTRKERLQQPHEIADVAGLYRAFGLRVAKGIGERPDHVSVEADFAAFLCAKAAAARETGDDDLATISVEARARLLEWHLGRWIPVFVARLLKERGDGFHAAAGKLARELVWADAERLSVEPVDERLILRVRKGEEPADPCTSCALAGIPAAPGGSLELP